MARHQAIAATSFALRTLLENAAATSEWAGGGVDLYQAKQLQEPIETNKAKLSIYLHRVVRSVARRDRGPRVDAEGRSYRPSIPLDLHYLITAWSSDAGTAHQLLGWAMRTIEDTPILPPALLNGYQSGAAVFEPDESVELVWDTLTIADLNNIWQVAQTVQSPCASYVARMVTLDSLVELEPAPLVGVRRFDYAKGPE